VVEAYKSNTAKHASRIIKIRVKSFKNFRVLLVVIVVLFYVMLWVLSFYKTCNCAGAGESRYNQVILKMWNNTNKKEIQSP